MAKLYFGEPVSRVECRAVNTLEGFRLSSLCPGDLSDSALTTSFPFPQQAPSGCCHPFPIPYSNSSTPLPAPLSAEPGGTPAPDHPCVSQPPSASIPSAQAACPGQGQEGQHRDKQARTPPQLHLNWLQPYLSRRENPLSPTKRKRTAFFSFFLGRVSSTAPGRAIPTSQRPLSSLPPKQGHPPFPVRPAAAVGAAPSPASTLHASGGAPALQQSLLLVATQAPEACAQPCAQGVHSPAGASAQQAPPCPSHSGKG